ncbi:hypothetical protein GCM10007147_25560 [Nocardiopsis kunsanensis]|uniref:Insertion element IS402-like domain-containing protein n=1 Tax=Nocardiopsis kunsanensis TaxID=141693 RepID=A0A918XDI5_9ACTN|nr:hypothetical protein GCM10007147_25560 [Nocardiopsis kunsanensis]
MVGTMTGRHERSDTEWALLAPLMPDHPRRGRRWAKHRKVINAILFRTRTGIPWRNLPERYGPWDRSRSAPPVVPGRDLATDRRPVAHRRRHRTRARRGRGFDHGAGPPPRRRGSEKGDRARQETDGHDALGRSRGGMCQVQSDTDQ